MGLRRVEFVDGQGRRWMRGLPDSVPDSHAVSGVPLGPPPLDDLDLPFDVKVRLHNELFARGLLTEIDVRKRPQEVISALGSALRVDASRIMAIYQGMGAVKAPEPVVLVTPRRKRMTV